jgi:hypothetical protein
MAVKTVPDVVRTSMRSRKWRKAASGVSPRAVKLKGSAIRARKPPSGNGSSKTGISMATLHEMKGYVG